MSDKFKDYLFTIGMYLLMLFMGFIALYLTHAGLTAAGKARSLKPVNEQTFSIGGANDIYSVLH